MCNRVFFIFTLVFIAACSTPQGKSPIVINEELLTIKVPDDYRTITEAISAVKAPCNIYVKPGVYNESISLKSGITLIGLGKDRSETIIQPKGNSAVIKVSSAKNVQIGNLTINVRARANFGIQVKDSSVVIYDCIIENAIGGTGLAALNSEVNMQDSYIKVCGAGLKFRTTSVLVKNNRIRACDIGLYFHATSGIVEDNEITMNNYVTIEDFDPRRVLVFRNNRIDRSGVLSIKGTSTTKFRNNYIGAHNMSMIIDPTAQPDFGTKDDLGKNTILCLINGWRDENPIYMVGNYWGSRYGPLPRKISKGLRSFLIVQPCLAAPPSGSKQMMFFRGYNNNR